MQQLIRRPFIFNESDECGIQPTRKRSIPSGKNFACSIRTLYELAEFDELENTPTKISSSHTHVQELSVTACPQAYRSAPSSLARNS